MFTTGRTKQNICVLILLQRCLSLGFFNLKVTDCRTRQNLAGHSNVKPRMLEWRTCNRWEKMTPTNRLMSMSPHAKIWKTCQEDVTVGRCNDLNMYVVCLEWNVLPSGKQHSMKPTNVSVWIKLAVIISEDGFAFELRSFFTMTDWYNVHITAIAALIHLLHCILPPLVN